jgi:hypothetical protein
MRTANTEIINAIQNTIYEIKESPDTRRYGYGIFNAYRADEFVQRKGPYGMENLWYRKMACRRRTSHL